MNIVHIVESTATGTLSMVSALANLQARKGHKVTVAYSFRPETPENFDDFFDPDVSLKNIQMFTTSEKMRAFLSVRRFLQTERPDFVFMHSSFAGFIGRISGLLLTGKYYYLPHCISVMRQDVGVFKKLIFAALEWCGSIKDSVFVGCSSSEVDVIRHWIPFRKCILLVNAVDTGKWCSTVNWGERSNTVVTVGQIRAQKDPERFAEICRKVKDHDSNVNFVWVGDGFSESDKQILISAGVQILGWCHPNKVADVLRDSKLYLSTSRWEGLPVAPIEAMLAGCVTVLSNCSGNKDLVETGSTGFLFDDTDTAASIIVRCFKDSKFESIAENGRRNSLERYSFERYQVDAEALLIN